MRKLSSGLAAMGVALVLMPAIGLADDWVVTKLRGNAAMLVGESWQPLRRGDVVSDDRAIRTLGGHMMLVRGQESIELGPQTAIRIGDRDGQQFTLVKQYFGTVVVEAEVRNVQHFGVQTPHLAAVVKGTRFSVSSDDEGATVSVQRGRVAVTDGDSGDTVLLEVGETAETGEGTALEVTERTAPGNSAGKGRSDDAPGRAIALERSAGAPGQNGERGNSGNSNAGGSDNAGGKGNAGGNGKGRD